MTAYQFPEERYRRIAEYERLVSQLTVDVDRLWKRAIETSPGPITNETKRPIGGDYGFAGPEWIALQTAYADHVAIENLRFNIDNIWRCRVVFDGVATVFTDQPYPNSHIGISPISRTLEVRKWIEAGGVYWFSSRDMALTVETNENHFFNALGSKLIAAKSSGFPAYLFGSAVGECPISTGLGGGLTPDGFGCGPFQQISVQPLGASPFTERRKRVFRYHNGLQSMLWAERLGDGILFVCGDKDFLDPARTNAVEFTRRLYDWDVGEML